MTRLPDDADPGAAPWNPPLRPDEGVPVSGWSTPLDFDPATNRGALERSTARLQTWLAVLLVVLAVSGVASALGLYFGGRALLGLVGSATSLLNPGPLPAATGWLLGLAALLVLVLTGIYLGVVNWARELIGRLGRWALAAPQAAAPDAVRVEQLRRTLAGWLRFGQWGTLLGALLSLGITLVVSFYADGWTRALGGSDTTPLGPGFLAVQTVSSLVSSVPAVVITWLILGAVLRFLNLAARRARGLATGPLTPVAKVLGNWFLACMILLGLLALQLLVVMVVALVALPLMRSDMALGVPQALRGLLGVLPGLVTGLLLFSLLLYGLYFALLLLSRSYALSLARSLDHPAAPPAAPRPTGSAGENPNIFRGQL